jgi:hypothetical protein
MRLERTYGFSQSDFIDSFQPESEGKFPAFHTTTLRTLLCWTEGHLPVAEHSFIASSRQQASKAITLVEIVGWCTEARSSCAITCQKSRGIRRMTLVRKWGPPNPSVARKVKIFSIIHTRRYPFYQFNHKLR